MLIIPAIDILGGKCVRLKRGEFSDKKIYSSDPVAVAKEWERQGAQMLHVVDLDGAKTGTPKNTAIIRSIAEAVKIPIEVGGGIRSEAVAHLFLAFARRIVLGTKALEDPRLVRKLIEDFGSERIVVALEQKGGKIAIEGWQSTSPKSYEDFAAELKQLGVRNILFTDVQRDGMLGEPNYDMTFKLAAASFSVISSGGVSSVEAIRKLRVVGAASAIIGTALYEGKITLAAALDAGRPASGLTKRIIPCLDVTEGKVVKGINFEHLQEVGDPVAMGKEYAEAGADELVFLDITASKDDRATLFGVVEAVAKNVFIPFTVGGGLKTLEDMRTALHLGADKVSLNTAAVQDPDLINAAAEAFGEQCVVVAMDVKKTPNGYKVFIKGGSEETQWEAIFWAKEVVRRGAGEILLTSMDRDGTKLGYDLDLLRTVSEAVPVPIIASGGAGSLEDLKDALTLGQADAVLAASLFHYGVFSVPQVKEYLAENGIQMRT